MSQLGLSRLFAWLHRQPIMQAGSQTGAQTVSLGLISEGTNTWPLYAAQALALFEREGINVAVTLTGSSVKQQEGLIAGQFDVGFQQADHVVRAVERGSDLFIFMPHGHAPEVTLVAARGVREIGELKGRTVAVDGARTGYALLLRRLLLDHGVPESAVKFEEIGGSRERFDAMKSGAVAATLLNAPFDAALIAQGYTGLARMSERFPGYPGSVMAARRAWAASHERELFAFIRAFDAAYAWLEDSANARQALTMLPERLAIAPAAAAAALEKLAARGRPSISHEGLQEVIDTVWTAESYRGAKGTSTKYMDLAYMQRALGRLRGACP
jgi:ABC-type nitrate/sulfonate/bicarbonate transport system substrate-binding protein